MHISRKYDVAKWRSLDLTHEADFQMAVTIFEDRLETRYLEHIRVLLPRDTSGFVVLALDCALIETLQQFRLGTPATPRGKGKKYFVSFLTTTRFSKYFDEESAGLFYKTIRCGLLHQTEAGATSRIKRGSDLPPVSYTSDHTGIIINTKRFHRLLEETIEDYLAELRTPEWTPARRAFLKKMNFICRVVETSTRTIPKISAGT
jgi:hypothetical protein